MPPGTTAPVMKLWSTSLTPVAAMSARPIVPVVVFVQ
jgi:hypothetical protein